MKIIHFITNETDTPKGRILFMSVLSGLSSGLLLAIINRSADQLVNSELESRLFIMYLLSFFLYIYTQRYAQHSAIEGVEAALQKVRLRIVNKVRQTELHFIEKNGSIAAYTFA
jgi:putative ATP-binding cassette transporter